MIETIWQEIEHSIAVKDPEILHNFRSGVDVASIEKVEVTTGYHLPEDVRVWLTIHNGTYKSFINEWQFLGCEEMVVQQHIQKQLFDAFIEEASDDALEEGVWWWIPPWIPWAQDGSGNLLCVDCDAKSETCEQIVYFNHVTCSRFIALDFTSLMQKLRDDLENDHYVFAEDKHLVSTTFTLTQAADDLRHLPTIYAMPFGNV